MIEGVKQTDNTSIYPREITSDSNVPEINKWLFENNINAIIGLGSISYDIRDKLPEDIPVIVGAMVVSPDGFDGISLAGDPVIFLNNLEVLAPSVKRIFVIYSKDNSGWLIDKARNASKTRDIQIIAYEAGNLKEGLKYYDQVLNEATGTQDAIWLPLDRIVPDKAILPRLLKSAWDKKFVVFSNNPLHVKKGVLFALYPDHRLMGQNLGEMAVERINSKTPPVLLPAKRLKIAVNKRTASHLDLHYSKNLQRNFSIVFPSE